MSCSLRESCAILKIDEAGSQTPVTHATPKRHGFNIVERKDWFVQKFTKVDFDFIRYLNILIQALFNLFRLYHTLDYHVFAFRHE